MNGNSSSIDVNSNGSPSPKWAGHPEDEPSPLNYASNSVSPILQPKRQATAPLRIQVALEACMKPNTNNKQIFGDDQASQEIPGFFGQKPSPNTHQFRDIAGAFPSRPLDQKQSVADVPTSNVQQTEQYLTKPQTSQAQFGHQNFSKSRIMRDPSNDFGMTSHFIPPFSQPVDQPKWGANPNNAMQAMGSLDQNQNITINVLNQNNSFQQPQTPETQSKSSVSVQTESVADGAHTCPTCFQSIPYQPQELDNDDSHPNNASQALSEESMHGLIWEITRVNRQTGEIKLLKQNIETRRFDKMLSKESENLEKYSRLPQVMQSVISDDGRHEQTLHNDMSTFQLKMPQRRQTELDVEMARSRIERNYLANIHADMRGVDGNFRLRRKQKDQPQLDALLKYFNQQPFWDYPTKIAICEKLGMTLAQVSKWNWDHRKKLGIATTRVKTEQKRLYKNE